MDRIYDRLVLAGECWEWTGRQTPSGYGSVNYQGRSRVAHRVIWEDLRGEIPAGLELDHLCRNTLCANPDHLDPVTHQENLLRGVQSWRGRTHCQRGHELIPDNIYITPSSGRHQCKPCLYGHRRFGVVDNQVLCPDCEQMITSSNLSRHRRRKHT